MSTLMHIVEEFTIDLELDRGGAREGKGKDAPWLRPDQEVGNRVFAFFPKLFRQQAKSFVQFFGHGRPQAHKIRRHEEQSFNDLLWRCKRESAAAICTTLILLAYAAREEGRPSII
jgi:hypothetical protein